MKYDEVRTLSKKADAIVKAVVEQYSKQLDEFITGIEIILARVKDEQQTLDDMTLQRVVLKLPILQYRMIDGIDMASIESDVSKAAAKLVYADHYGKATGTIPDRQSASELRTMDENTLVDLTKHVYTRLKSKMQAADNLFDAVRKVMTSRDSERQIFRKDKAQI